MKHVWSRFGRSFEKIQQSLKSDKNICTLYLKQSAFMIKYHKIILKIRHVCAITLTPYFTCQILVDSKVFQSVWSEV